MADHIELVVFGLLAMVTALAILARRVGVPYPVLLVLGGIGAGFIPGVPDVQLDPDLVLLLFLPLLLYSAAFFTSLRELRDHAGEIGLLAIGLVLVTMAFVAVASHLVIGLDWDVSFVLGAVVAPTDAVAPATILRELRVPRRLIAIVEGENLTNDWTALVLYRVAVAAVVSGSFSLGGASAKLLLTGVGGVALGLAVGYVVRRLRRSLDDPPIEVTISLLTGYAAYLPAEELGLSGVVAAVTAGVYMGWFTQELTTPTVRLYGTAIWEIVQFLLNAFLFVLIGLQLPLILDGLGGYSNGELALYGGLVAFVAVAARVVWVLGLAGLVRAAGVTTPTGEPETSPVGAAVVAWSGMRGAVSLAAALAIPLTVDGGAPFPERDLLIFCAFCTIFATLVFQSVTLAPLAARLAPAGELASEREELIARLGAAQAALTRAQDLAEEDWVHSDSLDRAVGLAEYRLRRLSARLDGDPDESLERRSRAYRRLTLEIIAAERDAISALRRQGGAGEAVLRKVEAELDLEEKRLD